MIFYVKTHFVILTFALTCSKSFSHLHKSKNNLTRIRRERCHYEAVIVNCDKDPDIVISQLRTNQIFSQIHTNCKFEAANYKWTVDRDPGIIVGSQANHEKSTFTIKPHELKPRDSPYIVDLKVTIVRKGKYEEISPVECLLVAEPEKPVAIIKGGKERIVAADAKFVMNAKKSIDQNVAVGTHGTLGYQWDCNLLEPPGKQIHLCEKSYFVNSLTVAAKYAKDAYKFNFTLIVKSEGKTDQTDQIVTIAANAVEVTLICVKNCPPASPRTDENSPIVLKAKTAKTKSKKYSYKWTVNDPNFDYVTGTEGGREKKKFTIKPNTLTKGQTYTIRVDLTGGSIGSASTEVTVFENARVKSCNVIPPQGQALETKFKVDCVHSGEISIFEVVCIQKDISTLVAKGVDVSELEFSLPSGKSDIFLKFHDAFGSNRIKLTVQVDLLIDENADDAVIESTVDKVSDLIDELLAKKDFQGASQAMNVLIEEVKQKKDRLRPGLFDKVKSRIMGSIAELHADTQDDAAHIASLIYHVVENNNDKSDADLAEKATQICKEGSKIAYEDLKRQLYPIAEADATVSSTRDFMSCCQVDTQENFEALETAPIFNITTPYPLLTIEVFAEDYPDYMDDEIIQDHKKKFADASDNFVEVCRTSLEAMSLTISEGDRTLSSVTDLCSVSVTRVDGEDLAEMSIDDKGITISNFVDFENSTETFDVRVCTWQKDPFWWNSEKTRASTNVLLLNVHDVLTDEDYSVFESPLKLVFKMTDKFEIYNVAVEFPSQKFENDADISIVRVTVRKFESFFVQFYLSDNDSFNVLMTEFTKPTVSEIAEKGYTVSKDQDSLYQNYSKDYNSWYYLSVIPKKLRGRFEKKLTYNISVYTVSCYTWIMADRKWEFACIGEPNSRIKKISCDCYHLSILMGTIYNNEIRIETVSDAEVRMHLRRFPVIFICVAVIFALYCCLIVAVVTHRKKQSKTIFLLSDNIRTARYVYLLRITTGKYPSSGTSGNVCIKLFGKDSASKSHVLNYPDPELRMLQRGEENWFVLTTERFLGEITKVALWSDMTGRNPSWRCQEITIFDLQLKQEWKFVVNSWLDLPPNSDVLIRIHNDLQTYKSSGKFAKIIAALSKLQIKRSNDDSSYFLKITVLLSIIVTILASGLIMYGLPAFKLNDAFTKFHNFGFHPEIFIISLASSAVSFVIHSILIWLFSNSAFSFSEDSDKKCSIRITILCWIFLTLQIVCLMAVLLVCGFWLPEITVWLWLMSVVFGVLVYFFIFDNVYKRVLSMKRDAEQKANFVWQYAEGLVRVVDRHRKYLMMEFGEYMLRPYLTHLYHKLDEYEIMERKLEQEHRLKFLTLIEDIIMFCLYIILLYVTVNTQKDPLTFINKNQMLSMLQGEFTHTFNFKSTTTKDELQEYVNTTFIPSLQSHQWYSRFVVKDPGIMIDFTNKFLGVARLRQKRVTLNKCSNSRYLRKLLRRQKCAPEFFQAEQDEDDIRDVNISHRMGSVWSYTEASSSGFTVVMGRFGNYFGGGYIAPLGRTMYNSFVNFEYLTRHKWIDRATRAVFVEFLTYNVNTNLFTACRIGFELSASGFIRTLAELQSSRLLFVKNEHEIVENTICISFVIIVGIFTLKCLIRMCKLRKMIFKNLWLLMDLLIIALSYACFALFITRMEYVRKFLDKLEESKRNEFINYFTLFQQDLTFTLVAAFLVFVSTVRLWKLLRFGTTFKVMEKTIIFSARYLMAIFVCHICVLLTFSLTAHVIFSDNLHQFKNIPDSFVSLAMLPLGVNKAYDLMEIIATEPVLGRIFHSSYLLTSMVVKYIYFTIIISSYHDARVFYSEQKTTFKDFVKEEFYFYKTLLGVRIKRLRAGASCTYKNVTDKEIEHRYAKSMSLSCDRLEAMSGIAKYHLKKNWAMSDDDKVGLMFTILGKLRNESDAKEIFFTAKTDENSIKLVPDEKFKRMERVAESILKGQKSKQMDKKLLLYKKNVGQQLARIKYFEEKLNISCNILANIEFS